MKKLLTACLVLVLASAAANAQKFSIGTNLVQWANLITYNGELGFSVSRHFSVTAGGRFNNTQIDHLDKHYIVQNKQTTFFGGMRYWPWYVNSGLWVGGKLQYQEYAQSGIWRSALEKGRRAGVGASVGYTLMLTKHLNLEFGACLWGGYAMKYTLYDCPICLNIRENGGKFFAGLDDISISLILVL